MKYLVAALWLAPAWPARALNIFECQHLFTIANAGPTQPPRKITVQRTPTGRLVITTAGQVNGFDLDAATGQLREVPRYGQAQIDAQLYTTDEFDQLTRRIRNRIRELIAQKDAGPIIEIKDPRHEVVATLTIEKGPTGPPVYTLTFIPTGQVTTNVDKATSLITDYVLEYLR